MIEDSFKSLPKGWVCTRLEDCVDILDSQRVPINAEERKKRKGNIPYYGATGQVGWIDDFIFDEELLLLGEDGAPFLDPHKPRAYIIRGKSWVNNHAHVLRAIAGITSNSTLCYYLNIFDFHSYVSGTTRLKLNQSPMRQIPIPLPPLPEQHRIVAKIEELFTMLDAGIEALKKIKAQLKRYRQAVLKYAFEGKLTQEWREVNKGKIEPASVLLERIKEERKKNMKGKNVGANRRVRPASGQTHWSAPTKELLPEGWEWTTLGEVTDYVESVNPKIEPNKEFVYLDIASIDNSQQRITNPKNYCGKDAPSRARQLVKSGDILFSTVRTYLKNIAMVNEIYGGQIASTGFCVIRPLPKIQNRFIFWLVQTDDFLNPLNQLQRGTSYPAVRDSDVFPQIIPLPPFYEQKKIVEEIESHLFMADNIEKVAEQSLKQSDRLRQSILKRAFEGKLVPQDPTDLPAVELLRQIKKEREVLDLPAVRQATGRKESKK